MFLSVSLPPHNAFEGELCNSRTYQTFPATNASLPQQSQKCTFSILAAALTEMLMLPQRSLSVLCVAAHFKMYIC